MILIGGTSIIGFDNGLSPIGAKPSSKVLMTQFFEACVHSLAKILYQWNIITDALCKETNRKILMISLLAYIES